MAGVISQRLLDGVPVERASASTSSTASARACASSTATTAATSPPAPASATASPRPRSAPRSIPSRTTASCTALRGLDRSRAPARPAGHDPPRGLRGRAVRDRRVPRRARPRPRLRQGHARRRRAPRLRALAAGRGPRPARPRRAPTAAPARGARRPAGSTASTRLGAALGAPLALAHVDSPRDVPRLRGSTRTGCDTRRRGDRDGAAGRRARPPTAARSACSTRRRTPSASRSACTATRTCATRSCSPTARSRCSTSRTSAHGPAAADLGQVLAGLIVARTPRAAGSLLDGYASVAAPPDRAALRWYTAASLLARVALPAVGRYRPERARPTRANCSTPAPRCSPRTGSPHEARAALLLPALGRPRAPDALLRAVREARRALQGRAAVRRRAAARHRAAEATSRSSRCRRSACSPATGFGSGDPRYTTERAWAVRERAHPRDAAPRRGPKVVLVELFPFGRAKFARELVPLLEQAREQGAFTACSLRDILVSTRADQRAHDDRAAALAERPPGRRARPLRPALRTPRGDLQAERTAAHPRALHGLRRPGATSRRATPREHIVVSAGGGRVGAPLLKAAMRGRPKAARCARSPAR